MNTVYFENKFNVQSHAFQGEGGEMNVPIFFYLSELEYGALQQYENLAQLPFAFHHVAAMPDSHLGYGMPIGGVLATKGYIIPNAVGVDIGCGMCCIKTNLYDHIDTDVLKKIMGDIRKLIPVGKKHNKKANSNYMPNLKKMNDRGVNYNKRLICDEQFDSATKQVGTLGGGNHFIEVQLGDDGYIYVMIHSGSRNLGKRIADYYNKVAVEMNEKWQSSVPKKWQLAFLPFNDDIGRNYFYEMEYACRFAYNNRLLMMERVEEAFLNHIEVEFDWDNFMNIHHNYAAVENHFRNNVIVHRKGATRAYKGEIGIIPGSQGTKSYIVEGLGNPKSFKSCSHGSGRLMSRSKAKENLDLEEEKRKLDEQGIIHGIRNIGDLDEASGAYKDIEDVMDHQTELVKIKIELQPLAVVKG